MNTHWDLGLGIQLRVSMHAQLVREPGFHPGTVKTRTELGAIPLLLNLPDLVTLL